MKREGSDNSATSYLPLPSRPGSLLLYNFFLALYSFVIKVYALINEKAKKWVAGRKDWQHFIKSTLIPNEKRVWIHCSSLGEFEQARPVIEALKQQFPSYKTVVTFFSPSGYEACKSNEFIDYVFYLPMDSKHNAQQFISAIDPLLVMFVKYEFWYHYLAQLYKQRVPAVLVSGAFREGQVFSKWYGGLFRDMLRCFSFFFLQDAQSESVLRTLGIDKNTLISGDTRYDRVAAIAKNVLPITAIEQFKGNNKIFIAGSTWRGDEGILKESVATLPAGWKFIIAPHEIGESHIRKVQQLFSESCILLSELDAENTGADKKVLIINNMGMLSRLFAYGDIAFIGGGFHKAGIHNILEPAVFGLPVIFGPAYEKFVEAKELVELQYVFPVNNATECNAVLGKLITDDEHRLQISSSLKMFMQEHTGATRVIIDTAIHENWLN